MTKVQKFLERIGLDKDTKIQNTYEFLKNVHFNAFISIPYENMDILQNIPVRLDFDSLFDKIVERKRGGYCFEVNALLSYMLKEMGFEVKSYLARFLRNAEGVPVRRHRVLAVEIGDALYMCDIGVGSPAPRYPLQIAQDMVQTQFNETYKFQKDEELGWVLYDLSEGEWRKFISFTCEKQFENDFIQPSFYCEKHIDSEFNKYPIIAIKTPDGRKTVNDREFKKFKGDEVIYQEQNISDERLEEILFNEFNIQYK